MFRDLSFFGTHFEFVSLEYSKVLIMVKKYFQFFVLITSLFLGIFSYSQTIETRTSANNTIEGLTIYPNPVSNGRLYIASTKKLAKSIEVFDVLGKKKLSTSLLGNTLDISKLTSGVYIIKIAEGNNIETRKLVVR